MSDESHLEHTIGTIASATVEVAPARVSPFVFTEELIPFAGGAELLIGASYVVISALLIYLVARARRDLPFHWMMLSFAVFILAGGTTHLVQAWMTRSQQPPYWAAESITVFTAITSVLTALLLLPLIPRLLGVIRSMQETAVRRAELETAYAELNELYRKATQPAPRKESISAFIDLTDQAQAARQLTMMAREVTQHARELERAKQEAEAANRAKDQFLAVLSHELRTPLTPALAAASNLESSPDLDEQELRESLGMIRRNIELEARLVDDLLDLTRISKGKLRVHLSTINLHSTIEHAVEMCQSEAHNKRSNLVVELLASDLYIRGDGARLAQVFWNLILNAVKFTPVDGEIRVRTSNPTSGRVRVEIMDSGIGIDADHLARIFEPFQQGDESTTRRYGGLGLGLSVAKGLVDAHGGTITAQSDGKNHGSTFTIELDTTVPPSAPTVEATAHPVRRHERLRVLIVEDHADTRRALERILSRWGHEIRTASNVREACDAAKEFDPDLLLSDIGLPDGTGIDLLRKVRRDRDITAIAMSGYGMEADIEQTRNAGFKDHLIKPVAAERLKEAIEKVIG